eukprot:scaffold135922_cov27-Tisochrysis_lutea.AAC.1
MVDVAAAMQVLAERASAAREERCAFCTPEQPQQTQQPTAGDGGADALEAEAAVSDTPVGLVQQVIREQECRVLEYKRFEDGFQRFLQVAEAEGYQSLVADTTEAFAKLSKRINAAASRLSHLALQDGEAESAAKCKTFAALIRRLQDYEREKLTATAQLQIVRHGIAVDALRLEHASICDGDTREDGDGAERVTATERTMDLRREEEQELRSRLLGLTEDISEVIDEIRCEVAEL